MSINSSATIQLNSNMSFSDITCPISREVFFNPLLCADGFSYEESFIRKWLSRNTNSPMIGSKLNNTKLRENHALCVYINVYKSMTSRLNNSRLHVGPSNETSLVDKEKKKFELILKHYYKSTLELNDCCNMMSEVYTSHPNNFDVAINYANILRFSTQFDKALTIIKTLKNMKSGTMTPKYMKVRVIAESGKKDKAGHFLKKVLAKYRIEDHLLIDIRFMSYALLSVGNRDHTFRVISTYLKVVPNDTRALTHYIYVNLLLENYAYVIETTDKYLKNFPDDISMLFHQAKAYTRLNKKKEAVVIYETISKYSIDKSVKAKALYESALNRDSKVEFDVVVKKLEESYKLDPKEEADGYLAALYVDKKMFKEAEQWMNYCANRVNIMNDNVYLGIQVLIQEHKGLINEAVASYIRLAELDGANSMYYNSRIEILFRQLSVKSIRTKQ